MTRQALGIFDGDGAQNVQHSPVGCLALAYQSGLLRRLAEITDNVSLPMGNEVHRIGWIERGLRTKVVRKFLS